MRLSKQTKETIKNVAMVLAIFAAGYFIISLCAIADQTLRS